MAMERGVYTVEEIDAAIKREQAWVEKCRQEGSRAEKHFADNVEWLKGQRDAEAAYRRGLKK